MKYIVTENWDDNRKKEIFIFDESINHDHMMEMLSRIKRDVGNGWERQHREAVSAGFYDGRRCHGRSETLNLNSNPEDIKLIRSRGW